MSRPIYKLTLHRTYYDKGFFNLGVAVERFVRPDSGPVRLRLGPSGMQIDAKVSRTANTNGTPRVYGGPELRNWIQRNFKMLDVVDVSIESPTEFWIRKAHS